ncbi:MAG TPA: YfhO family protein, partial [Clostridia bacterium]|nr:YfhO family protein [Clostridia bacterium]
MKGNQKYVTTIILLLCFLTPALVLLFAFSAYGMAPFGEKSIMIMDMSGQYSEFYIGLRHFGKMGNMFFSWSKTLGTSY